MREKALDTGKARSEDTLIMAPGVSSVHHDIEALIDDINEWYGDPLPTDEGYDAYLVPVSDLDLNGDGTFDLGEAYAILVRPAKPYKDLWKPLANWFNYAMYWLPYTG